MQCFGQTVYSISLLNSVQCSVANVRFTCCSIVVPWPLSSSLVISRRRFVYLFHPFLIWLVLIERRRWVDASVESRGKFQFAIPVLVSSWIFSLCEHFSYSEFVTTCSRAGSHIHTNTHTHFPRWPDCGSLPRRLQLAAALPNGSSAESFCISSWLIRKMSFVFVCPSRFPLAADLILGFI